MTEYKKSPKFKYPEMPQPEINPNFKPKMKYPKMPQPDINPNFKPKMKYPKIERLPTIRQAQGSAEKPE